MRHSEYCHEHIKLRLSSNVPLQSVSVRRELPESASLRHFSYIMQALAQEVAAHLGLQLGPVRIKRFADGEIYVQVKESIRGCDVFLLQPTCPTHSASVNDTLMELMVMVDACRCSLSALLCLPSWHST
jgi:hypothetical protein